jgi:hypothetical protein
MDYRLVSTKIVIVFNIDAFDIGQLLYSSQKFMKAFNFKNEPAPSPQEQGTFVLTGGTYKIGDEDITISEFKFQPRKIIISTMAPTAFTEEVTEAINQFLIDNGILKDKEVLFKTYESTTVIKENYTMNDICENTILGGMISQIEKLTTDANDNSKVARSIFLNTLKFEIDYNDIEHYYGERGLALNPKFITIERRMKTAPLEGIFYISTPYVWEEHQKILEYLRIKYN